MISRMMMMNNLSKSLLKPLLKPFPRTLTTSITRSTLNNSFRIPYVRYYSDHPSPLQIPQIESRVLQLLRDFDKVTADKLTLDAHFINDLGLDSLDQVEITMALEDEFNIEIPDKDAEEIFTVRQAVEKIFSNKNAM